MNDDRVGGTAITRLAPICTVAPRFGINGLMQQHIKGRGMSVGIVGLLAMTTIGCQSGAPRPVFPTDQRPAATSIVNEGGGLVITYVNGKRLPGHSRFASQFSSDNHRYEVPAGACSLGVQYADAKFKTVQFTARSGVEYQLDSFLKPRILNFPIQQDQWDVMVKEKSSKTVITETRDARK